jgi:hypothetical protein
MKIFFAIVFLFAFLLLPISAHADLGPKPSMTFDISAPEGMVIIGGEQYECQDADCKDIQPLGEAGPQRFFCIIQEKRCFSQAYGYAPYHKLSLRFSDTVRESNIFQAVAFDAFFSIRVTDGALVIEEKKSEISGRDMFTPFFGAAFITIILELVAAFFVFLMVRAPKKKTLLFVILFGNIITLPLVWFAFPTIRPAHLAIPLAEGFAIMFEAWWLWIMGKKQFSFPRSLALSIFLNMVSVICGEIISLALYTPYLFDRFR